jgi:capsular exopolysaccharide synthesis family protein
MLIVGVLGLLAGLVLALILERFDTKVRTRRGAEERFGLPVIAEIPRLQRRERRVIVPLTMPTSTAADAFRLLGAGVGVVTPNRNGARARTVLVTSPGPSDGKTTIVTNVAAALAEEGSRVLVVSADVRRPRVHEVFETERGPGLAEAVKETNPELNDFVQTSAVSNVWVLGSGNRSARPAAVVGSPQARSLLEQARDRVDWILIDTSPLLAATESALLLPEADLVLLVAMAKRTSATLARRTTETLEQLQVPSVRVVLNEAKEVVMPSGYRRYYRKIDQDAAEERQSSFGFDDPNPEEIEHAERPDRGEG